MKSSVPNLVVVKNRRLVPLLLLVIFACGLQSPAPVFADPTEVSGTISTNTTWSGEILIVGNVHVSSGVTLTVLPGTKVMFKHYRGYREQWKRLNLTASGIIYAVGTAENPIYFTSDAEQPQNGDWNMMRLFGPGSVFSYCVIECGRQGINVWNTDLDISHSVIRWHNWEGLYLESYCTGMVEYCHIVQNGYNGLAAEQYNNFTMDHCEIERSGTCGVHIDASTAEVRCCLVHDNLANGLSVDNNATLRAYGDEIIDNGWGRGGCGIGFGGGDNTVEVSNLTLSNNCSGDICGPYTTVTTSYFPPGSNDIGFTPDMSYALGYTPGDPELDNYMYVYPDDETRRTIRRIGTGLGLSWSLAWDGEYIWTATLQGTIYKLDPVTGAILQQFPSEGPQPWGMTYDGTNLWVVDFAEKSISKMNPSTGAVLATYPTPDTSGGCKGVTWDGTNLCVMGWTSSVIYKMDQSGNHVATLGLDSGGGGGIAWDGRHFWIPSGGGEKIFKYDADGHQVGWVYAASEGTWDMTWDGEYLWTAERTNENWEDAKIFMLEILDDHDYVPVTWYVDGSNTNEGDGTKFNPFSTIDEAIKAASKLNHDIIIVADGTYKGQGNTDLDFEGKTITVRSKNGPLHCTIDCEDSSRAFYFDSGESADCLIEGFTIVNGSTYYGGALYCEDSNPTIDNCIIRANSAVYGGGAILCSEGSPTITNCILIGNSANYGGGAIACWWQAEPNITNCLIVGNSSVGSGGGIDCWSYSKPNITSCTIADNSALTGGAIQCDDYSDMVVTNSILWGNEAPDGPQLYLSNDSNAWLAYTDVQGGEPNIYVEPDCELGWDGSDISADPCFVSGAGGDYYLSQTAAGQATNSPCVDAGSDTAANLGLDEYTTRTDQVNDDATVDIGSHYGYMPELVPADADIDGDGDVDFDDYAFIGSKWQQAPCEPSADIVPVVRDGIVDIADLTFLTGNWLWNYPNMVSHWKFDEGAGDTAYDSAGDNYGTLINNPVWVAGKTGSWALSFDGLNDYVSMPDNSSLDGNSGFSVSAWFEFNDTEAVGTIFAKVETSGAYDGYVCAVSADNTIDCRVYGNAANCHMLGSELEPDTWYNVVLVYDGDSSEAIYINGFEDATDSVNVGDISNDIAFTIGSKLKSGSFQPFNGTIDDVRFFNRALTAEEIWRLYNKGK